MMPSAPIVHSASDDPFFNHALEEWLLRTFDRNTPLLFTCTNAPGVVIGRNQVPWKECDLSAIKRRGLFFSRRISGGGTVYHDHGNANFGIIAPRSMYNPTRHLELAANTLARLGVKTHITQRRSLFHNDRKLSGTAFMLTTKTTLQHATMLVQADLLTLRSILLDSSSAIETAAVSSVPATVANLMEFIPGMTVDRFHEALQNTFTAEYAAPHETMVVDSQSSMCQTPEFQQLLDKYRSEEWIIGRTPKFAFELAGESGRIHLAVENGAVARVETDDDELTGHLDAALTGKTFDPVTLRAALRAAAPPKNANFANDWIKALEKLFTAD